MDCGALYRDFLKGKGLSALKASLPHLLSPTRLRKALETLLYPMKRFNSVLAGAEILNFAVRPACRGTGVAQMLFTELMEQFRAKGVKRVKVMTSEGQVRAQKFYARMGAKRVASTSIHKGQNDIVFLFEHKVIEHGSS